LYLCGSFVKKLCHVLPVTKYLIERIKSFYYSFSGIGHFITTEANARIHLFATVMVVIAGWYYEVSRTEWTLIVGCSVTVIAFEAMNTALERLCDAVTTEQHPLIGQAKDVAAGAVLIVALGAAIIGIVIFWPKIV
jgi:diacylglycerol kinase (ATP)